MEAVRKFLVEVPKVRTAQAEMAVEPGVPPRWDANAYREILAGTAEKAEQLDLVCDDLKRLLFDFELSIMQAVVAFVESEAYPLAAEVGLTVAATVFGGKDYQKALAKQLAVASTAVGLCAVEERVAFGMQNTLRLCLVMDVEPRLPRRRLRRLFGVSATRD